MELTWTWERHLVLCLGLVDVDTLGIRNPHVEINQIQPEIAEFLGNGIRKGKSPPHKPSPWQRLRSGFSQGLAWEARTWEQKSLDPTLKKASVTCF